MLLLSFLLGQVKCDEEREGSPARGGYVKVSSGGGMDALLVLRKDAELTW